MSQETPTDSVWLERARRSSARHLGAGALALLPPHASTRRYARWTPDAAGAVSRVGMLLPLAQDAPDEVGGALVERIEEEPFVVVQQWLAQAGVRVPHVLALDRDDHVIWLEDVGSLDFDQWLQRDRPPRVEAYQAALSTLKRWQQLDRTTAPRIVTERRFDERLIAWELDHYRTWRLETDLGHVVGPAEAEVLDAAFRRMVEEVAALPVGVMHRDFQSHNLMVCGAPSGRTSVPPKDAEIVVLDFQDAMLGPQVYDLVALLRDSYVALEPAELDALLTWWTEGGSAAECAALRRAFHVQTLQRKLKDAGRFVFLDRVRGRSSFLAFVPTTVQYIDEALSHLPDFSDLRDVLRTLEPALRCST